MLGRRGMDRRRRRPRGLLPTDRPLDTALLHERLRRAVPLELHAHVSRVACCAVVAGTTPRLRVRDGGKDFCLVSGDAVGNLSFFFMTVSDVCTKLESEVEDDAATQRLRIRPDVRCRGAHRGSINCMHYLKGTTLLLTGGDDGAVRLWDVQEVAIRESKAQCKQEFLFHSSCVMAITSDSSQTLIASTGLDGVVALWLKNIPIPLMTIPVGEPCTDVSFLDSDPSLIQVAHEDCISVWDLIAQPHYLHFQRALSAQLGDAGRCTPTQVALGGFFPDLHELAWSSISNTLEKELMRHRVKGPPNSRATEFDEFRKRYVQSFSPHGTNSRLLRARAISIRSALLTSATDLTHKLWDLESRRGVASFEALKHHQREVDKASAALVAPGLLCSEQRFLYGADDRGDIHVWDLRSAVTSLHHQPDPVVHPTHTIHGHAFFVTSIALSADNTILVTGDASGKLHVRMAVS